MLKDVFRGPGSCPTGVYKSYGLRTLALFGFLLGKEVLGGVMYNRHLFIHNYILLLLL